MSIWITGDTHGQYKDRLNTWAFPEQQDLIKDDYVVILGDFGGVWRTNTTSFSEKDA